jgi:diketogulonate reductase-like aldo/keto reductase
MASSFLQNYPIIYGTHRMTTGLPYGFEYGIIDTATGYNNAMIIKQTMNETGLYPLVITKFSPNDFLTGIENIAKQHVTELCQQPAIVLLHSPFGSGGENLKAVLHLKILFPLALIGVSNFDLNQTTYLVENGFIPDVIQLEYHPFFQPKKLLSYCQEKGIKIMAYRPFAKGIILKNDKIIELSKRLNIKPNHLVLSWLKQKNIIPIVSSNNPDNIISNAETIELDMETIKFINSMDMGPAGSTCMVKYSNVGSNDSIF